MQPLAKVNQSLIFTDHAWLDEDRLAGATAEGEIYIYENFEFKQKVENAFKSDTLMSVSCLKAYSKGFFVSSDTGNMALWVKQEENNTSPLG